MDFLISTVLAIILLYFISSTSAYKSMYKKIKEEKEIIEEEVTKLEALIQRYEKQVKIGTSSLKIIKKIYKLHVMIYKILDLRILL